MLIDYPHLLRINTAVENKLYLEVFSDYLIRRLSFLISFIIRLENVVSFQTVRTFTFFLNHLLSVGTSNKPGKTSIIVLKIKSINQSIF
jgi:hypothetical protein